ncbi:MAG TPA: sigma-70 family RNA polymerase sigma factor [Bacilli bacterium]|nr:sigma-70 family RNA polymerase sigma factor [Bacilli bacterium]
MNYKEYNDYELLSYVNDNNEEADVIIYNKYKPLIEQNARKMLKYSKYNGLDLNDLIQEGMLGLSNAIKTFNDSKEASFFTYARTCIERKQISALIGSQRLKHKLLNESLPFETYDKDQEVIELDQIIADNSTNPENILTEYETSEELIQKINSKLTYFEQQVFNLKISGFNYIEIADLLSKSKKQIDNAIQRIKIKIKDLNN